MDGINLSPTQPSQAKELAQELLLICYQFARTAAKAADLGSQDPAIWSQLIGELASQSLQSTLTASGHGSIDMVGRDEYRHKCESWIHQQLEAEAKAAVAASGRVTPQFGKVPAAGAPISPSVEVNGSPLYVPGRAYSTAPGSLPGFAYSNGDPLTAGPGMMVDSEYSRLRPAVRGFFPAG